MKQESADVNWKTIILAIILIPINSYWIAKSETGSSIFYSTTSSLFCNVIFNIFVLTLFNELYRLLIKKPLFSQAQLLVLYSTLSVASAMSGESVGQQLVRDISAPFWYATPENEWATLFHQHLPKWLVVTDKKALKAFYGSSSQASALYSWTHFKVWIIPLIPWFSFILILLFVMTCINVILRRQWIEYERLTYPVIQLPYFMASGSKAFLCNKMMWIGFSIASLITLMNGLHHLYPSIPGIKNIYNVSDLFVSRPWNSIQPMVIAFYPCAIGLAYFMPLDLSFSTWFFFFFWKAQIILGSVLGLHGLPEFPYARWQQTGGYLAVGVLALWLSRRHIARAFKSVWSISDSSEPMSYRLSVLGAIIGFALMLLFCVQIGIELWVAGLFLGVYLLISIAVTRMRAELGPLVHELYYSNSDQVITAMFGTRRIKAESLSGISMFWWMLRSQNSHVMPHQLEAFKLAERASISSRRLCSFMLVSALLGTIACSWAVLDINYRQEGNGGFAIESYTRLQLWLTNPRMTDAPASLFMGLGFIFATFLMWMKRRFIWWQFHPIGYAVTQGDWAITYIWFPIFLSWLLKLSILKFGGLKSHRTAVPIFLGLILGDFVMGASWGLIGLATGLPVYHFKNW